MIKKIIPSALINAGGTALYVIGIASFLTNASYIFGPDEPKSVFVPIMMLLILIISASVTGSLVLGRPILWYLDGKKKEAISLFIATLISLSVIVGILVTILSPAIKSY